MEIGEPYSDGIIVEAEQDINKPYWIKIRHRDGGTSIINFNRSKDLIDKPHCTSGKGVRLTAEEFAIINERYAELKEENEQLKEENKRLKQHVTDILNGKV